MATSEPEAQTMSRAWQAGGGRAVVALVALTAALLAAGALVLGDAAPRQEAGDAASTTFPGGALRVDGVSLQHRMSAEDMGGMPMPKSPAVRDVPRGQRRFTISVTVSARAAKGVRVTPNRFRLTTPGAAPAAPIDEDTDTVFVPAGAAFPRDLTFDVPRRAESAQLSIEGAAHPIPVTLGPAPASGGGHGAH